MNEKSVLGEALQNPHRFFEKIKKGNQTFVGICEGTMSHGEEWNFIHLGSMLERADKTSRILDVKYFILLPDVDYVGSPFDKIQWAALLKSASALGMYRKRFHRITPGDVADFLILEPDFPRSIRYCLTQAEYSLHRITGSPMDSFSNLAEQTLGKLRSEFEFTQINEIMDSGLHEFLDNFQTQLNGVGDAIQSSFFDIKTLSGNQSLEMEQ